MSTLPFKASPKLPPRQPAWWPELKRIAALVILGPKTAPARPPLPDTVELARDGKISGWLRMD